MVAITSQIYFRFCWFDHVWRLEGLELSAHQISTWYLNPRPRYYYFWFLKTNGRHLEILLLVSILTFSLPSACDSALAYQILCKSDDRRRSYDVILILQDGGHSVTIYFRFLIWPCLTFRTVQSYRHTIFRPDISIHVRYITISGFWKKQRPPYWNSTFGFDFDLFTAIGVWYSIATSNFIEIGSSTAELWRHNNFQDGGHQPCWIWFRAIVAHPRSASGGLCFVLKFQLDRFTVFEIERFSYFDILAWNCLFTPTVRGLWGHISPNDVVYLCNPKRHFLVRKHVIWAIKRKNRSNGSTWAQDREKKDRTVKKVTKALYFTYFHLH